MFGPDRFEDWVTPAVVRHVFLVCALAGLAQSQPFERVAALFSGFVPGGIVTVLGSSFPYAVLYVLCDKCIEIRALVF